MLLTKTRAADLAGVSRRTFYSHIPKKRISVTKGEDGRDYVELSELERVYGKEVVANNLKKEMNAETESVKERETAHSLSGQDNLVLRERIKNLEERNKLLETYTQREREQLTEEIENLRESLRKAQDTHSQLGLLITHQEKRADIDSSSNKKIESLEKTVRVLKKSNVQLQRELKKGLFQKLFGS